MGDPHRQLRKAGHAVVEREQIAWESIEVKRERIGAAIKASAKSPRGGAPAAPEARIMTIKGATVNIN